MNKPYFLLICILTIQGDIVVQLLHFIFRGDKLTVHYEHFLTNHKVEVSIKDFNYKNAEYFLKFKYEKEKVEKSLKCSKFEYNLTTFQALFQSSIPYIVFCSMLETVQIPVTDNCESKLGELFTVNVTDSTITYKDDCTKEGII